jgi:hypothetical protein
MCKLHIYLTYFLLLIPQHCRIIDNIFLCIFEIPICQIMQCMFKIVFTFHVSTQIMTKEMGDLNRRSDKLDLLYLFKIQ